MLPQLHGRKIRRVRKQISVCHLLSCWFLSQLGLRHWNGGVTFLRNVGWLLTDYKPLYPRRYNYSWLPLWEPQILHATGYLDLKLHVGYDPRSGCWVSVSAIPCKMVDNSHRGYCNCNLLALYDGMDRTGRTPSSSICIKIPARRQALLTAVVCPCR
jgi:hypothetical protein